MPRPVTPGDCTALSEFIPVAPVPVGLLWVPGAVVTPFPPGPPLPAGAPSALGQRRRYGRKRQCRSQRQGVLLA
jgi:hypothetical protein